MITEWPWRTAILSALGWSTRYAKSDPLQDSLDALREDVATLNEKVDAMMAAMMQLKR